MMMTPEAWRLGVLGWPSGVGLGGLGWLGWLGVGWLGCVVGCWVGWLGGWSRLGGECRGVRSLLFYERRKMENEIWRPDFFEKENKNAKTNKYKKKKGKKTKRKRKKTTNGKSLWTHCPDFIGTCCGHTAWKKLR